MIQHKKYDNEITDDMIKNENKKYKKSSYEEIRELVLEKEKKAILQLKIRLRKIKWKYLKIIILIKRIIRNYSICTKYLFLEINEITIIKYVLIN